MTKKMIKYSGGCICGEIKFIVNSDEKPRVFNCHCIDCRKKLGGMISIIDLREDAIDVDKNKLAIYEHKGGSGNIINKYYCKKCTAPVLTYVAKWKKFYLYAGLLDDISILKTASNLYFKDSHFPFMEIDEKKVKV